MRTNAQAAYTAKISLTRAGATSLRVVKPRSATRAAGTSKPVALTVQKWIDLAQAPHLAVGAGFHHHPATIAGTRYASSLQAAGSGMYAFATGGACSRLELRFGFRDADRPLLASDAAMSLAVASAARFEGALPDEGAEVQRTGIGAAKRVGVDLGTDRFVAMIVEAQGYAEGSDMGVPIRTVIAEPRMLCSVDTLPAIGDEDIFGALS